MSVLYGPFLQLPIFYWWLPLLTSLAALAVCAWQGSRKRSIGLVLLGAWFAYGVSMKIEGARAQARENRIILDRFVQRQVGPNMWTAPVLHMSLGVAAPFSDGLLLLAVMLVGRRISKVPAEERG